jgi:hypothetical protein
MGKKRGKDKNFVAILFYRCLRYVRLISWSYWRKSRHCATSRKVTISIPDYVIGIFNWQFFRPHYGPGVASSSNRNKEQEYFLVR